MIARRDPTFVNSKAIIFAVPVPGSENIVIATKQPTNLALFGSQPSFEILVVHLRSLAAEIDFDNDIVNTKVAVLIYAFKYGPIRFD